MHTYLFERELYCFILSLFQNIHKFLNSMIVLVQLLFPGRQFLLALGKIHKLLQGLLVDMAVLLQLCVGLVKLLPQLKICTWCHAMMKKPQAANNLVSGPSLNYP
jgi:hypothetical protein